MQEFKQRTGLDITGVHKPMCKLEVAAESAKRTLSTAVTASIDIDCLYQGEDFHTDITRTRLEHVCDDLFRRCVNPVRSCLRDAKLEPSEISQVVLVGGSTCIPKIQELVQEVFGPGKTLCTSLNADEAVAQGAAIHAAVLTQYDTAPSDVVLRNVTPLSLGVAIDFIGHMGVLIRDHMSVIIPRNTPISHSATMGYQTQYDNQKAVAFNVYEGECKRAKDNELLDTFNLTEIPPGPAGKEKLDVTMYIDVDGILYVTAVHLGTDNLKTINVQSSNGRVCEDELVRMLRNAKIHEREDKAAQKRTEAKRSLEEYAYKLLAGVQQDGGLKKLLSKSSLQELATESQRALSWVQLGGSMEVYEYRERLKGLEKILERAVLATPYVASVTGMCLP